MISEFGRLEGMPLTLPEDFDISMLKVGERYILSFERAGYTEGIADTVNDSIDIIVTSVDKPNHTIYGDVKSVGE